MYLFTYPFSCHVSTYVDGWGGRGGERVVALKGIPPPYNDYIIGVFSFSASYSQLNVLSLLLFSSSL